MSNRRASLLGTLAALLALLLGVHLLTPRESGHDLGGFSPSAPSTSKDEPEGGAAAPRLSGRPAADLPADTPLESVPSGGKPGRWTVTAKVLSSQNEDPSGWSRPAGEAPLSGATVRLWLVAEGKTEFIAKGTTNSSGQVAIDLPEVGSRSRNRIARSRLVGHAVAPGHYEWRGMPVRAGRLLDEHLEPKSRLMVFTLHPSSVVRGVVLRNGEPLRFAAVSLASADGSSKRGGFGFTDPAGRYALSVPGPGKFQVLSRRRDVEVGSSEVFSVDGGQDVELPPLHLHPLPEKRGVVRFRDGTPVANLSFELDHPSFDIHYDPWVPSLGHVRVRTDDLGAFRVVLPRVDSMSGRIQGGFTAEIPGVDAEKTRFDPSAPDLRMELSAHRLRVQVQGADGSPVQGLDVSFFLDGKRWPSARGASDATGEVSLFLEPGRHGHLFVVGAGHLPVTRAIEIPGVGNESVVTLDVPDRQASGVLALRMRTPAGEPVLPVTVDVETPEGFDIVEQEFKTDDDRIVLPPGTYRVRLWSSKEHASWKEEVPDIRSVVKLDEAVVVRAGETSSVDVEWTPTSALAVKLQVPGGSEDTLEESRAYLQGAGGERRFLSMSPKYGRGYGPLRANDWLFTTWLQDPGSYLLTIEAKGFRTLSRTISLVAEKVTWIEIVMERGP
jgi:hypothetical protein